MNQRILDLIGKVERGESVDWEQEAALQTLDIVKAGEEFKDEIVALMGTQDGEHRYDRVKSIEFLNDGGIAKVEFYEPRTGAGA